MTEETKKQYRLRDAFDREYESTEPGTLGGHRKNKIFGRLDCPSALSWIARGHYTGQRVFFDQKETAVQAGYRPCGSCMREEYQEWKADPEGYRTSILK